MRSRILIGGAALALALGCAGALAASAQAVLADEGPTASATASVPPVDGSAWSGPAGSVIALDAAGLAADEAVSVTATLRADASETASPSAAPSTITAQPATVQADGTVTLVITIPLREQPGTYDLAIVAGATATQAQITVTSRAADDRGTVNPGESVTIAQYGFVPGESVTVTARTATDTVLLSTVVVANEWGAISVPIVIPSDAPAGAVFVSAAVSDDLEFPLVSFTIPVPTSPTPSLTSSPSASSKPSDKPSSSPSPSPSADSPAETQAPAPEPVWPVVPVAPQPSTSASPQTPNVTSIATISTGDESGNPAASLSAGTSTDSGWLAGVESESASPSVFVGAPAGSAPASTNEAAVQIVTPTSSTGATSLWWIAGAAAAFVAAATVGVVLAIRRRP